jgi:hypothetical protein
VIFPRQDTALGLHFTPVYHCKASYLNDSMLFCCISCTHLYRGYICTAQKIANIQEELDDLVRSALPAASLRGDAVGYKRCMKLKEAYRHTRRTMDGECVADVTLISSSNGSNGSNSNCQQVQCSAPKFTVPAAAAAAVAAVTAAVAPEMCAGA